MSTTLIDSVKSIFTVEMAKRLAALLGESEQDTRKAVQGAIPSVLTGILKKIEAPDGVASVFTLSKQAAASDLHGQLHELMLGSGGLVVGNTLASKGGEYLTSVLGDRTDPMASTLAQYAGVKTSSAAFILGLTAQSSLDSIGRHISNANLDSRGMAAWLWAQRDGIVDTIPKGLNVTGALGLRHLPGTKAGSGMRRNSTIYGIIGLVIIIVIIFFAWKTCTTPRTSVATTDTATMAVPADTTKTTPAAGPSVIKVALPDGSSIDAEKGGTEDQLVTFLSDPQAPIDKKNGNWFDFTKVGFASNSAQLLLESEPQLKNIITILNAFPKARIKIGGYTDNTGDSVENVRLSQQRADKVLATLKNLGAHSAQLTGAKGYGSQYPVGDNGTASGRGMNRRMSLEVKAK